jgi:hypothetical protein
MEDYAVKKLPDACSGEEICKEIAFYFKEAHGTIKDPKAIWETSPTGELWPVFELWKVARAWMREHNRNPYEEGVLVLG